MIAMGWRSPEMLKWCRERWVWAPQSLSAGTAISPRLSRSILMFMGILLPMRGVFPSMNPNGGRGQLAHDTVLLIISKAYYIGCVL